MDMKNLKIISIVIIFLSIIGFTNTVMATEASLYVSPETLTKTVGSIFNTYVGFNTSDNKVCAVEGKLVFNNLTCQSITLADGFMAQSSPTCANPYFLIGIPNCATVNTNLLTISVKSGVVGKAFVSITGADVMGEGMSVGSTYTSGSYTITAVPAVVTPVSPQPEATTEVVTPEEVVPTTTTVPTTEETINQPAALSGAVQANLWENLGNWIVANIFWIIILIISIIIIFITVAIIKSKKGYKQIKK